jgi:heterodisulfide reductase subunit B
VSYVFFPGCSLEGTARDFHRSTLAVAGRLRLAFPEIPDWICCGSTSAHGCDPLLADALPAKNLAAADGKTVAVACASCYSRLKAANHHIARDPAVRARVAEAIGRDYDGRTPVMHLLEILSRDIGCARIAAAVRRPLKGLKVACYYGCLLVRPPEITRFDDAENPTLMDQLMEIAGATPVDWPHKTESWSCRTASSPWPGTRARTASSPPARSASSTSTCGSRTSRRGSAGGTTCRSSTSPSSSASPWAATPASCRSRAWWWRRTRS